LLASLFSLGNVHRSWPRAHAHARTRRGPFPREE